MSSFPTVDPEGADPRRMARVVRGLMDGKSNNTGTFTLAASTTTTTVEDPRVGPESVILWCPLHADAAAEIGAGSMYVSDRSGGEFTVTHASDASTHRDFAYVVIG